MSKAKLKKELQTLDKDQLVEVLLSTYSASAGAKDYLEFFLNPDLEALIEKKLKIVSKELNRSKYGYCKARVSVINKEVKSFAAYGIAPEYIARLVLDIFVLMVVEERFTHFSATHVGTAGKLVERYILECSAAGMLETGLNELKKIYDSPKIGREGFKAYMPAWIRGAISQLPPETVLPEIDFSK